MSGSRLIVFSDILATISAAKRLPVSKVNIHLFANKYISHHNEYGMTTYSKLTTPLNFIYFLSNSCHLKALLLGCL